MAEKKIAIEVHSILRDLLRNLWVLFCAALIGVLGAYIVNHVIYHPVYTSAATVIVNSAAGKTNAVATLSQSSEIAAIYAEVFVQPTMEEKVCEYLEKETFDGVIHAHVNSGTNIMELSVTASNPEEAYRELRAILKVYPKITESLYSNGVVSVLRPASLPKSPSNTMTSISLLKIALLGMVIAAAIIVVLSLIRDTVKNEKGFTEKIDARLLGVIPHERKHVSLRDTLRGTKKGILFSESAFTSLKFTENFNKISAKLDYMQRTKGDQVFAVTSVAENEGKSTIASNLAISLAIKGKKVVLLDLDCKKPALYKLFEQEPDENYELGALLSGGIEPQDFKLRRYKKTNLFLALNTRPHREYQTWFEDGTVERVFSALKRTVDYVIVDTAPLSVDGSVTGLAQLCDATILTVRTDAVYVPMLNDSILTLKNTGAKFAGCILNDVYEDLTLFSQFGTDESGYARSLKYGRYNKYANRYAKYSKYAKYGAAKYEKYADANAIADVELTPEEMPQILMDAPHDGAQTEKTADAAPAAEETAETVGEARKDASYDPAAQAESESEAEAKEEPETKEMKAEAEPKAASEREPEATEKDAPPAEIETEENGGSV